MPSTPQPALAGVRVLDLTYGVAGPFATKIMAALGAEVVKIEAPDGGDPTRRLGPFDGDRPHPERSGLFLDLNAGKKSVTLDLHTATGAALARRLAAGADIVVEAFPPGEAERLGLGYEALSAENPELTYVSVSNFGAVGPYSDFLGSDLTLYAMGGEMYGTGMPGEPPVRLPEYTTAYQAGNLAATAGLIGYYGAQRNRAGQAVEVSIFESAVHSADRRLQYVMSYAYSGQKNTRNDNHWALYPTGVYPCKDGFFDIHGGGPQFFHRTCRMLGMPELLDDPRFSHPLDLIDPQRKDEFDAIFLPWVIDRTKEECLAATRSNSVYGSPIFTPEDAFHDTHFAARGFFKRVEHPGLGRPITVPGEPVKIAGSAWATLPAPTLGQHNEEILVGQLGLERETLSALRRRGVA